LPKLVDVVSMEDVLVLSNRDQMPDLKQAKAAQAAK